VGLAGAFGAGLALGSQSLRKPDIWIPPMRVIVSVKATRSPGTDFGPCPGARPGRGAGAHSGSPARLPPASSMTNRIRLAGLKLEGSRGNPD
jgi:hypothetical protein